MTALHARSPACQPRCCLRDCDQVQDWLYTRDAAKATAAQALALASSKQMRAQPLPHSQPSAALFRGAASSSAVESVPLDARTSSRSSKRDAPSASRKAAETALLSAPPLPSAAASSARARSSSPLASSAIDATITSMVAGGTSGTTAIQRHLKRNGARALSAAAAGAGAASVVSHRPPTAAAPVQQLFSVIL